MAFNHTLVESESGRPTSATTCLAVVSIFVDSVERLLEGERCAFFTISESMLPQSNDRTDVDAASGANIAFMDPNSCLADHFILNKRKYRPPQSGIACPITANCSFVTPACRNFSDVALLSPLLWRRVARR
jgi:hypothetical protein